MNGQESKDFLNDLMDYLLVLHMKNPSKFHGIMDAVIYKSLKLQIEKLLKEGEKQK